MITFKIEIKIKYYNCNNPGPTMRPTWPKNGPNLLLDGIMILYRPFWPAGDRPATNGHLGRE